jgi:hypothetical protein
MPTILSRYKVDEAMKKKVFQMELEIEAFDNIVANDLQYHYTLMSGDIRKLRKKVEKSKKTIHIQELKYLEGLLPAIRAVGAFYGRKLK